MPNIFEEAEKLLNQETVEPGQEGAAPAQGNKTESKDSTKEYSERLNADRAKMRKEIEEDVARSFGYDSYEAYRKGANNRVIKDAGYEPEKISPLIDQLVANHPDVIAARELRASMAAKEVNEKDAVELSTLNSKYGTSYTSIDELDAPTKDLYNKGIPLAKAYGAEHLDELVMAKDNVVPSKSHLNPPIVSSNSPKAPKTISKEQLDAYRAITGASDEEIMKHFQKE